VRVTKSLLADAFEHHVWSTLRLIDACLPLSAEQLAATAPGLYGSILDTMRHLVGADAGYLFALTAGERREIDEDSLGLQALRSEMETNGTAWSRLLEQDLDPEAIVTRHRVDGSQSHAPRGVRLAQALHHGTDHRSQICTILTTLGVEPPEIDVWDYARAGGRLSETPAPA
jgi:uncharacterized damage-inducible protein DinB